MNTINRNAAGFAVGTAVSALHALLAVGMWAMPDIMQKLVDFIITLHFMKAGVVAQSFSLVSAITLVIITFCIGYCVGCVIATVYNWKSK